VGAQLAISFDLETNNVAPVPFRPSRTSAFRPIISSAAVRRGRGQIWLWSTGPSQIPLLYQNSCEGDPLGCVERAPVWGRSW